MSVKFMLFGTVLAYWKYGKFAFEKFEKVSCFQFKTFQQF